MSIAPTASESPENGKVLPKNPATIHYDSRKLKLIHRKLYNVLLYFSFEDQKRELHSIPLWTVCDIIGSHRVNDVKNALKEMQTILIEWDVFSSGGNQVWGSSQMLGSCEITQGPNMQILEYSFPVHLRNKLRNPGMWAMIKIDVQNLLKSKYAHALYEQCARFTDVGTTGEKEVEDWYKILGVPESSIKRGWSFVNAQYIKPSIEKINECTDMNISVKTRKFGYHTKWAKFDITVNSDFKLPRPGQQFKLIEKDHLANQIATFAPDFNPAEEYLKQSRAGVKPQYGQQLPLLPE